MKSAKIAHPKFGKPGTSLSRSLPALKIPSGARPRPQVGKPGPSAYVRLPDKHGTKR